MGSFLTPKELSGSLVEVGRKKAELDLGKMILLGLLAGVYIGFAAHLATTVATGSFEWWGLKKFFVGAVFSVGLMLVIIPGSELFTGNCLMSVALCDRKISIGAMFRNWGVVWLANLVGSILLAFIIVKLTGLNNGPVGATAINIGAAKCGLTPLQMIFRGVLANWLVCLAVMLALASKDIISKIFGIFFPIMAFVTSGFEHSIANMYFLPAGLFSKTFEAANSNISGAKLEILSFANSALNIGLVTIGNVIGGALLVGVVYWYLYVKELKS